MGGALGSSQRVAFGRASKGSGDRGADVCAASPRDMLVARRWIFAALFASIFLQRFGLPIKEGIPLNLAVTLACLLVLTLRGMLTIAVLPAIALCTFLAYAGLCALMNPVTASATSLGLMLALYAPFVLSLRSGGDALFHFSLRTFQNMVLVCAALGIFQFIAQSAISSPLLYTFQGTFPSGFLLKGFNNILPLQYGSALNKSNGFFFVEPSTFSQYTALAIVIEIAFFGSIKRLLTYGAALLVSFSGTGLILLALLLPGLLIKRRAWGLAAGIVIFGLVAAAGGQAWHMGASGSRVTEFSSNESSAHARFIAPLELIERFQISRPDDLLIGFGPGSMIDYIRRMPFETHDPTAAKLLFEYGIIGSMLFWVLYGVSVFGGCPSGWMAAALTIGFLVFGGMLLDPRLQILILLFCVLPKRQPAIRRPAPSRARLILRAGIP